MCVCTYVFLYTCRRMHSNSERPVCKHIVTFVILDVRRPLDAHSEGPYNPQPFP